MPCSIFKNEPADATKLNTNYFFLVISELKLKAHLDKISTGTSMSKSKAEIEDIKANIEVHVLRQVVGKYSQCRLCLS